MNTTGTKVPAQDPLPLWGGRFSQKPAELAVQFNASLPFDQNLLEEDIAGSKAHAAMLGRIGVLTNEEADGIIKGLEQVKQKILMEPECLEMAYEDIHMAVEQLLTNEIGEAAKKLHTGRSRNDQVATDFRLFCMGQNHHLRAGIAELMRVLVKLAKTHQGSVMPGYTHLQKAQPITLGYHLLAYVGMLQRDYERLSEIYVRCSQLPLGSGAIAGVPYPSDREFLKGTLGFEGIMLHAMDAVSDRDFAVELLSAGALLQMHLSRLAEEIILWSTGEFDFMKLSDGYCTGSSLMPQKKNPDLAELIRGKTGRIYGNLFNLLTVLKALPLAYNKDLQEDKEPVMDTCRTLNQILPILSQMLTEATFHTEKMKVAASTGGMNATALADAFVEEGIPFRSAHELAGKAVALAERKAIALEELPAQDYEAILSGWDGWDSVVRGGQQPLLGKLHEKLTLEAALKSRKSPGSAAPQEIQKLIDHYESMISLMNA